MVFRCAMFFVILTVGMHAHARADDSDVRIAREIYDFSANFSLGNIGIGGVFPVGDNSLETSATLLSFGTEHNRTGLGVWFSPLSVLSWSHWDNHDDGHLSFINLHVYWNVLSRELFFGPFVSANYFFVDHDMFHWDRYMLTVGLQGGIRLETERWNLPFFSVETGFRLIDGNGNFFVGTKIDLLPLLLWRLGLWFAMADDVYFFW